MYNNPYEWENYNIQYRLYMEKRIGNSNSKLNAGDLLIFDSRLVHRVIEHQPRSIVYVSMVPRKFISNLVERLRKKAYKKNYSTTHWCEKVIKTGQDVPKQNNLEYNELVWCIFECNKIFNK